MVNSSNPRFAVPTAFKLAIAAETTSFAGVADIVRPAAQYRTWTSC